MCKNFCLRAVSTGRKLIWLMASPRCHIPKWPNLLYWYLWCLPDTIWLERVKKNYKFVYCLICEAVWQNQAELGIGKNLFFGIWWRLIKSSFQCHLFVIWLLILHIYIDVWKMNEKQEKPSQTNWLPQELSVRNYVKIYVFHVFMKITYGYG